MLAEYIRFWRDFDPTKSRRVHPEDEYGLRHPAFNGLLNGDLSSLVKMGSLPKGKEKSLLEKALHLQLFPAPHTGTLPTPKSLL